MYQLAITHSPAEGTLIDGTSKGDGTAEVLKAHGWRWFRSIGVWGIPRSRDRRPRYDQIHRTRAALAAAGFTIAVDIDDSLRPTAEVEDDKTARQAARVAALEAKAERTAAAAEDANQHARALAEGIPFGQPAITDAMRRTYKQLHRRDDQARQARRDATAAEQKLKAAEPTTGARYAPGTVGNRIERLEADVRDRERKLSGYRNHLGDVFAPATGEYAERLHRDLIELGDQLKYWRQVRADQVANGQATDYSADTIKAGDQVQIHGSGWWTVKRANKKTVTVENLGCSTRAPYHRILAHQPSITE